MLLTDRQVFFTVSDLCLCLDGAKKKDNSRILNGSPFRIRWPHFTDVLCLCAVLLYVNREWLWFDCAFFMFGRPTEQRWSFYVSGPVSQLGISQLLLGQMVLPYVSLTFPQLQFCHLFTYLLDQLLSRTDGRSAVSLRNKKCPFSMADSQRRLVFSKRHCHIRNTSLLIFFF